MVPFCTICSPLTHCALCTAHQINNTGSDKAKKACLEPRSWCCLASPPFQVQTSTTFRNRTGENEESNAAFRKVRGISTANISQSKKEKWNEQHSQWEAENFPAHVLTCRACLREWRCVSRFPRKKECLHSRRSKCRDAYFTRANMSTCHDAAQQPPSIFTPGVPLSRSTAQQLRGRPTSCWKPSRISYLVVSA